MPLLLGQVPNRPVHDNGPTGLVYGWTLLRCVPSRNLFPNKHFLNRNRLGGTHGDPVLGVHEVHGSPCLFVGAVEHDGAAHGVDEVHVEETRH